MSRASEVRRTGFPGGVARVAAAAALVLGLAAAGSLPADPAGRLEKGKFLIAKRHLWDPNFAHSVVLLVEHSREGAMGLIVNRSSEVTLATVQPELEGVVGRPDTVFLGGPVGRQMMILLVRAERQREGTLPVFDDVYVSSSPLLLGHLIGEGVARDRLKVFAGHAGWSPGQLENEVARGDWLIWPADADTVFDPEPEDVWQRLIRRDEDLVASLRMPPIAP
jgi:putative transcriptional regulator